MNTRVSIIIPTLNRAEKLAAQLARIVHERRTYYSNLEIIVMDGGSTDRTPEVVEKFRSEIDQLVSRRDGGIYPAFNGGIALATGELVRIVSDDDVFLSGHTPRFVEFLQQHPEIDVAAGVAAYYRVRPGQPRVRIPTPGFSGELTEDKLARVVLGPFVTTECMFFRAGIFKEIGLFETRYKISSDLEFKFRILRNRKRIHVLPPVILEKLIHEGSASQASYRQSLPEIGRILCRYGHRTMAALFLSRCYLFEAAKSILPRSLMDELKLQAARLIMRRPTESSPS